MKSRQSRSSVDSNITFFRDELNSYRNQVLSLDTYARIRRSIDEVLQGVSCLLDIGNGGVFDYNVELIPKIVAVDLFLDQIDVRLSPANVRFVTASALSLPMPDSKFDAVVVNMLLHHLVAPSVDESIGNMGSALSEAWRVLKPGGCLVLVESCVPPWFYLFERLVFRLAGRVIPLITSHPVTLQYPADIVARQIGRIGAQAEVTAIPKGRWVLQYGVKFPAFLTPAPPLSVRRAQARLKAERNTICHHAGYHESSPRMDQRGVVVSDRSRTVTAALNRDDPETLAGPPMAFTAIRREQLVSSTGVRYEDFRSTLTPRYGLAWLQLLSGHVMLVVTGVAIGVAYRHWPSLGWALSLLGAFPFGYMLTYVILFFHEAAHYNLASNRRLNDRLANIFIGVFQGRQIQLYRPIHFDHHRHLGKTIDPEHSYFDPLTVRFIVESIVGIKAVKAVMRLYKASRLGGNASAPADRMFPVGLAFHGVLLSSLFVTGLWPVAVAWIIGVAFVYPFLAALRQLLEHRDENASPDVDFAVVPHGAVNRVFGSGLLASTLGSAGFNRHMLHHWEAQISCTRLRELEEFLRDTPAAAHLIAARRTSYYKTFVQLLKRSYAK